MNIFGLGDIAVEDNLAGGTGDVAKDAAVRVREVSIGPSVANWPTDNAVDVLRIAEEVRELRQVIGGEAGRGRASNRRNQYGVTAQRKRFEYLLYRANIGSRLD